MNALWKTEKSGKSEGECQAAKQEKNQKTTDFEPGLTFNALFLL